MRWMLMIFLMGFLISGCGETQPPVRVVATNHVDVNKPGETINGVILSTKPRKARVLLPMQKDASENGVYDFNGPSAPLTRSVNMETSVHTERTKTMNATLPKSLHEPLIQDMKVGADGWTVPWAMWADRHGQLWLNGNYTINGRPGGTVAMHILRTPEGFHVDISQCPDHRWSPEEPSFVGGANPMPVTKLIGGPSQESH